MRKLVFGFGGLQVVLSTALLAGAAMLMRRGRQAGLCHRHGTGTVIHRDHHSNCSPRKSDWALRQAASAFAVLLMQDVAVVPMLLILTALAAPEGTNLGLALAWGRRAGYACGQS